MAYSKRYVGGFVDLPTKTTAIDSQFLNAVETALLLLNPSDPSTSQVPIWDGTKFTPGFIADAQVAAGAAIAYSKLALTGHIVNADIASGAAIAYAKLALSGAILNGDLAGSIDFAKLNVNYGTTLPGSPIDKQLAILVDSTTAPTYQWVFRYNANSVNTDKWEYVGGSPGYNGVHEDSTVETTSSTTYAALTTAGPSFALPRSGVYDIEIGFTGGQSAVFGLMSYDIGGTGAIDGDAVRQQNTALTTADGSQQRSQRKTGLTAVTLTAKYKTSGSGTAAFTARWMKITPVRVS